MSRRVLLVRSLACYLRLVALLVAGGVADWCYLGLVALTQGNVFVQNVP